MSAGTLAHEAPEIVDNRLDLRQVFVAYSPRLRGLIRNTVYDDDVVEDVLQDTFLRAQGAIDRFDPTLPVWPWLSTIAKRLCFDLLRSRSRPCVVVDMTARNGPWDRAEAEDHTARADDRTIVSDALNLVSTRQRRLLALHYLGGLSYQGIAEREGVTTDAVKASLKRARRAVRERYEP
jgi:RNA polymerase sigma-70 factor (ECF subfamily)